MNFLYCFDSNYNLQALNSINSLLSKSNQKYSIYIIHENPSTVQEKIDKLNINNFHSIQIFEYDSKYTNFPRVSGTHVSDATYYRLFLNAYLPSDIDFITYIDADILCLKNPEEEINRTISVMQKQNSPLAAMTESIDNPDYIDRLDLKQPKYFNAGVLVINFSEWKKINNDNKFIKNLNHLAEKILWWDQDVLNYTFDGNYTEMSKFLNYKIEPMTDFQTSEIDDNVFFLHYTGNLKPWSLRGLKIKYSKYYQESFRELNLEKYHIVSNNFTSDFYIFLNILFFGFNKVEYKLSFIRSSIKAIYFHLVSKLKLKIKK